jgi:predicted alpha/beta-hydrolase family hydrolase
MVTFLESKPEGAPMARLLLAHGAGAAMDSPFLNQMAVLLAARGVSVLRFEFSYMAARRASSKRRPAPKAVAVMDEYRAAVAVAPRDGVPLLIGGKSFGGRVASLIADEVFRAKRSHGLVCLGYPFHPSGDPLTWRTEHLRELATPALIVQGERDPLGSRGEVEAKIANWELSSALRFAWIGDGDHDFGPRGSSGFTRQGNLVAAADAVADFVRDVVSS